MTIDKQKLKALAQAVADLEDNPEREDEHAEAVDVLWLNVHCHTILALLAEIEQLCDSYEQVCGNYNRVSFASEERGKQADQLKAENETLRKDADRLNWLDDHYANVVEGYGEHAELVAIRWAVEGQCSTVREALDDAMAKEVSRDC